MPRKAAPIAFKQRFVIELTASVARARLVIGDDGVQDLFKALVSKRRRMGNIEREAQGVISPAFTRLNTRRIRYTAPMPIRAAITTV